MLTTQHYIEVVGPSDARVRRTSSEPLEPGTVRVQVAYCGLCRSDIEAIASFGGSTGARFGHEVAGVVVEAPSESRAERGQRVVALVADGYASEVNPHASRLVPVPPNVSLEEACLAEPVACILAGVDRVDLSTTKDVWVIGSGFMGLLALEVLTARGYRVTVVEPREAAREQAYRHGASRAITPEEAQPLQEAANVVFECSGGQAGLDLASNLAAIEAQLAIVGYHQSAGGVRRVDMKAWNFKCLRVINAHIRSEERILMLIERALAMMSAGAIRPIQLVTDRIELLGLPEWLHAESARRGESIKAVVRCLTPDVPVIEREGNERTLA